MSPGEIRMSFKKSCPRHELEGFVHQREKSYTSLEYHAHLYITRVNIAEDRLRHRVLEAKIIKII